MNASFGHSLLRNIRTYLVLTGSVLLAIFAFLILAAMASFMGIVAWMIAVFVIVEGVRKYRAGRQYGLLWLLTVSAERSMPLAPAVEAFAREQWGRFGRRAQELAKMLDAGVPLPDALDRCPGLLPANALPIIRVGCESGALAPALRQATTIYDFHEPVWSVVISRLAYFLALLTFGMSILAFVLLKIIPSFVKIFKDFGTEMPALTRSLMWVSYAFVNYWYLFAPFYMLVVLLLGYALARYFGWIDWDPPGMARFARRFDSARILDSLAMVARQQRPLPEGIAMLARSYPKEAIRWRLHRTMTDIEGGRDWCESLMDHGLLRRPELAILQAAQRVGNLPWALAEMADSVRRRLAYRVQAAVQVAFPPIVIVLGFVVMFIVVALFLPLIALIEKLA